MVAIATCPPVFVVALLVLRWPHVPGRRWRLAVRLLLLRLPLLLPLLLLLLLPVLLRLPLLALLRLLPLGVGTHSVRVLRDGGGRCVRCEVNRVSEAARPAGGGAAGRIGVRGDRAGRLGEGVHRC